MLPQLPHFFDFIHVRDRGDLPHLALVLVLTLGIIVGVYLALQPQIFNKQASEGSLVEVKFIPEVISVQSGRVYEAKIAIDPKGQRVTALQLAIGYNPAKVTILEAKNEGFLPITLKTKDTFDGTLNLVYGATIETNATAPGMIATIKFKSNSSETSELSIKGGSQVNVSSQEGNALTTFPVLKLEEGAGGSLTGNEDIRYPDSLLLEKAFRSDSEPFVQEFREAIEPVPEIKPERIKPGFSEAYILQLGRDIFVNPIVALNEVIEEKAGEIINRSEK